VSLILPFLLFMSQHLCVQSKFKISMCSSKEVDTHLFILPDVVINSFDELHVYIIIYFAGLNGMPNVPVTNAFKCSLFQWLHSTKIIDLGHLTAYHLKTTHVIEQHMDERLPNHIRLQRGT